MEVTGGVPGDLENAEMFFSFFFFCHSILIRTEGTKGRREGGRERGREGGLGYVALRATLYNLTPILTCIM